MPRFRTRRSPYKKRLKMTGEEWLHHLYGELMERETHWMGTRVLKNPLDAWVYQEMIYELQPDTIVELGSAFGGSAMFLSHMLDLIGKGRVVTVDHHHGEFRGDHHRITKVTGRTLDVVNEVDALCEGTTLLIHDASHVEEDVLADLRAYAHLVTPGSYFIVEDGARDLMSDLTGPLAAIGRFLEETEEFEVDDSRERFVLTYNPRGFLRRH